MNILSERLKQLRTEKGMTQGDIAELLNIKRSTYGEYERGKIVPPIEKIEALASIFKVAPQYLIGWEESASTNTSDQMVGGIVKRLIENEKISSEEFAKELGISVFNLTQYEDGTSHMPMDTTKIIAYYFSVPVEKLLSVNTFNDALEIVYDLEQKELTARLKKWTNEFGETTFTDEEIDKIIHYAKYLVYLRKE